MIKLKFRFYRIRNRLFQWIVEREWMADLYWNQDDPEIPYYTVEDWAAYEGIGMYTGPRTVTMQRAIRLRSITYKVTPYQPNEEWDDVEYKVEIVK